MVTLFCSTSLLLRERGPVRVPTISSGLSTPWIFASDPNFLFYEVTFT